ncbi:hypothetical protein NUKP74_23820 [Klebsiella quasipneumoniae]|nr:hypothetical protein NUKP74_23820 [Klebsiella quasipneumoniae]
MTKSTITRERIQRIIRAIDSEAYDEEEIREWLSSDEIMELSRMALAAMDSESGCLPLDYLQGHKDGLEWAAKLAEANHPETGDWLHNDPIELAKAIRKGPDMPPAQPVADSEPVAWLLSGGGAKNVVVFDSGNAYADPLREVTPLYRHAQPAPVVPNGLRLALSNAGIAAPESDEMLAATCEKHIQALVTWVKDRKPFQSAPVVPSFEEWLSAANRKPLGWVKDAMREAFDACRAAMLAAAPQSPGSEPATMPGKWIPVSEQKPDCWCLTCRPVVLNDMRFVVCPDCGNKRCPRANDHRNACTGSNEPGQEGGAYPDTPQEVKP